MKRGHTIDVLFGLLLFCLFAVLMLVVLMSGVGAYRGIEQSMQSHFDQRTALSYISAKVRHYDQAGCVTVEPFGDGDALCLLEDIEGDTYCTWIYVKDGRLMELFAEADSGLPPDSGQELLEVSGLELSWEGNLLTVICTNSDGEAANLRLSLRAEGRVV